MHHVHPFLLSLLLAASASAQGSSLCQFTSDNVVFDDGVSMGGPNLLLAIKLQAPATLAVTRLEVWTGEQTGVNTLGLWSHDPVSNQPLANLGTGQWNMGRANGWQGCIVPTMVITTGADFWLVWGPSNGAQASVETRGSTQNPPPGAQYYRGSFDNGQSWSGGNTGWRAELWKFRIRCGGNPGSYEVFGAGCRGTGRSTPALGFSDALTIGQSMEVNLTSAPLSTPALLAIGHSDQTWLGLGLPLDMTPFGAPGCRVLCSALAFITVQTTNGSAGVFLTPPMDPSLVGAAIFNQWWVVDLLSTPLGLTFSNGGRGIIGN